MADKALALAVSLADFATEVEAIYDQDPIRITPKSHRRRRVKRSAS
jgi:hypothetical protein